MEPVVAGIDPVTLQPFVANLDLIGCPMIAEDFAVSGTCTEQMYGMCESLWVPDMVCIATFLGLPYVRVSPDTSFFGPLSGRVFKNRRFVRVFGPSRKYIRTLPIAKANDGTIQRSILGLSLWLSEIQA